MLRRSWLVLPVCVLLSWVPAPTSSLGAIHPAQVVAGPSNEIIEVDGAAMAPDGTGGIVYRARADGVVHVFAVPFANGVWGAPEEVDSEDRFGASQPAIAAGEGGRLLVVWVQPRNVSSAGVTLYELQSATHDPGSETFGQAITVDANVGEPFSGNAGRVEPKLAMSPSGQAYAVYRVMVDECNLGGADSSGANPHNDECRQGDAVVEVRVARYEYLLWSQLGAVNRAPQVAMPRPTPENAPAIGIDVEGRGVVAWSEPANAGEPMRVWSRRLFGSVQGTVLPASPETLGGRPVSGNAEAPEVIVGHYGEAKVAYRIDGRARSAVPVSQLFVNTLASRFDTGGGEFSGPAALPGAAASGIGGVSGALGEHGAYRLGWDQAGAVTLLSGGESGAGTPAVLGSSSGPVLETLNPAGGGTTTWRATAGSSPVVRAREDYAGGAYQTAALAGNVPGPITGLCLGGSGEGDALIGWLQGPAGRAEVLGGFVQAPPTRFGVTVPTGWVRSRQIPIEWETASDAVAGVTYSVFVDGHRLLSGQTGTTARLPASELGDGPHEVQVLAADSLGQGTMSAQTKLEVDIGVPAVRVASIEHGRGVRVTVRDPIVAVARSATRIAFGDGAHARGRARVEHRYRRAGAYTITAYVRDKNGNGATVHVRVRAR
ncbi:MAG: PKD domain-containing protein [Solirubrobacterales bacterium]|nr:PKD domain-containing protein [Solirubrobacterales bacterium]